MSTKIACARMHARTAVAMGVVVLMTFLKAKHPFASFACGVGKASIDSSCLTAGAPFAVRMRRREVSFRAKAEGQQDEPEDSEDSMRKKYGGIDMDKANARLAAAKAKARIAKKEEEKAKNGGQKAFEEKVGSGPGFGQVALTSALLLFVIIAFQLTMIQQMGRGQNQLVPPGVAENTYTLKRPLGADPTSPPPAGVVPNGRNLSPG